MSIKRLIARGSWLMVVLWLMVAGWCSAGTMRDLGDCYGSCAMVGDTSLSCTATSCVGYGGYHFGEYADGWLKKSIYSDDCHYYNGTATLPCVKKRYSLSVDDEDPENPVYDYSWVTIDPARTSRAALEPIYLLLLGVIPNGGGFMAPPPDPAPLPSAVDYSVEVYCYDAEVEKLYYSYTQGSVNAYPIVLSCNDASTWTGDRVFFIQPESGRGALATLLFHKISTDPDLKLLLSFTSYTAGSFVGNITIGAACTDGCAVQVGCWFDEFVINCDACTGAVCP